MNLPLNTATPSAATKTMQGYLAGLGTVAIWAGFILISRLGGKSALTGWDIAALRLGVGSLILLPFSFSLPRSVWLDLKLWVLALSGGAVFLVLIYGGLKLAPAVHGGILVPGMQPFLTTLIAWLILGTRPPRQRVIALIPIAAGVLCVAVPTLTGAEIDIATLTGDGLLLAASTLWALYSILAKKWAYSPWILTRFLALASTLVYLPIYLIFCPKGLAETSTSMLLLQGLYQGIGPTILAMLFFLRAVAILGAERTGALISLVPIISGLAAVSVLGEPLSAWLVAGLILVSAGAYLASRPIKV
jgi:drug/metabolite transporter (DMT)-like permease